MPATWNTRVHAGLAIALFLGSLGTLLYNSYTAATLPQQELQVRASLQEASRVMANSADSVLRSFSRQSSQQLEQLHQVLTVVTNQALTNFAGIEGGFYLSDVDRFSGYGFPTSRKDLPPELHRTDPPPLEAPLIRVQALQSLSEGTPFSTKPINVAPFTAWLPARPNQDLDLIVKIIGGAPLGGRQSLNWTSSHVDRMYDATKVAGLAGYLSESSATGVAGS